MFGAGFGLSLSGRGDFGCSGLGRGCSDLFGCVRGGRRRAWLGLVCCWGGATVSRCGGGWGAVGAGGEMPALPPSLVIPASLFPSLPRSAAAISPRAVPKPRARIRRPKLDLGPNRRSSAGQRTEMSCKRGWRATPDPRTASGVGFGPQIKFGATDSGAGVGGRSGRLERWRRDTRGKRGYDGVGARVWRRQCAA